jgi:hypothetical protein
LEEAAPVAEQQTVVVKVVAVPVVTFLHPVM